MTKKTTAAELSEIISQSEAARLRGVSREAIRGLIDRGRLRSIKVGGRLCVYREDVLNYRPGRAGPPPKRAAKKVIAKK